MLWSLYFVMVSLLCCEWPNLLMLIFSLEIPEACTLPGPVLCLGALVILIMTAGYMSAKIHQGNLRNEIRYSQILKSPHHAQDRSRCQLSRSPRVFQKVNFMGMGA